MAMDNTRFSLQEDTIENKTDTLPTKVSVPVTTEGFLFCLPNRVQFKTGGSFLL